MVVFGISWWCCRCCFWLFFCANFLGLVGCFVLLLFFLFGVCFSGVVLFGGGLCVGGVLVFLAFSRKCTVSVFCFFLLFGCVILRVVCCFGLCVLVLGGCLFGCFGACWGVGWGGVFFWFGVVLFCFFVFVGGVWGCVFCWWGFGGWVFGCFLLFGGVFLWVLVSVFFFLQ